MKPLDIRLREWSTVTAATPGAEGLANRGFDGSISRNLAEQLRAMQFLDVEELRTGLRITSYSHVGRIRLGDIMITIEPKLDSRSLLTLFRYAYGLRHLSLYETTPSGVDVLMLSDLLAAQLLAEVTELADRGLARHYIARTDDLSTPRGQIDFLSLVRQATPSAEIACRYHPRSLDHLLSQVISQGVQLASTIASDGPLRSALHRLHTRLRAEISPVSLNYAVLAAARRKLNRLLVAYEPALRLIELLYSGNSISMDADSSLLVPGFLFDMNRFFQALVNRWLCDYLDGYTVQDEHSLRGMMRYLPAMNPRHRRAPAPRPDFLVLRGKKPVVLLDAKYRDLWQRELPREMLYQLSVYALSGVGSNTAAIIYPTSDLNATEAKIEIGDAFRGVVTGYVALRPMILPNLVHALSTNSPESTRQAIAASLAFGGPSEAGTRSAVL